MSARGTSPMGYAVPVNAASEVDALADAGATELYCGLLEEDWARRYGNHDSMSRRQGRANLGSVEELRAVVRECKRRKITCWLALNVRYTEPQLDYLVGLVQKFERMGGDGVIVSDLGLLWRLKEKGAGLRRALSLLAVAQNVATLRAYASLGVSRVVLPRFVTPKHAKQLLSAVPGMEAEVMAFFDKCLWVDGYCRHPHLVAYADRPEGSPGDAPPLHTFDTTYRGHACMAAGRPVPAPFPCASCTLPQFAQAGVGIAKVGGRGRPLEERLTALSFLRDAAMLSNRKDRAHLYQQRFGVPCTCYYGSNAQRSDAIEPRLDHLGRTDLRYVGSQTSIAAAWDALSALLDGHAPSHEPSKTRKPLGVMLPPLSEEALRRICSLWPQLAKALPQDSVVIINDLGTLVVLADQIKACGKKGCAGAGVKLAMGSLLACVDDHRIVSRNLDATLNPPRTIWDDCAMARTLTYTPPPQELIEHWRTPSAVGASAARALTGLTGLERVPYAWD